MKLTVKVITKYQQSQQRECFWPPSPIPKIKYWSRHKYSEDKGRNKLVGDIWRLPYLIGSPCSLLRVLALVFLTGNTLFNPEFPHLLSYTSPSLYCIPSNKPVSISNSPAQGWVDPEQQSSTSKARNVYFHVGVLYTRVSQPSSWRPPGGPHFCSFPAPESNNEEGTNNQGHRKPGTGREGTKMWTVWGFLRTRLRNTDTESVHINCASLCYGSLDMVKKLWRRTLHTGPGIGSWTRDPHVAWPADLH